MQDDDIGDIRLKIQRVREFRARMYRYVRPKPAPPKPEPAPKIIPPPPLTVRVLPPGETAPIVKLASMHQIVNATADYLHLPRMKMFLRDRHYPYVDTRHLMWLEIKRLQPNRSTNEVGRLFMRDHTTVMHALWKYRWTTEQLKAFCIEPTTPLRDLVERTRELMRLDAQQNGYRNPEFPDEEKEPA